MTSLDDLAALGAFLLLNFAAASSGAVFRPGAWYASLAKPSWTPPNWAFPVVWSVLFLLNAVSGWFVWQVAGPAAGLALVTYALSLVINAAWSGVFFGLRQMGAALIVVSGLWLSILAVAGLFLAFSPAAAVLQLPYLIWVSLATVLNFQVMRMNPNAPRSLGARQAE